MGMFNRAQKQFIKVIVLTLVMTGFSHADGASQSVNDPTHKSLEAGSVEIVQNDGGIVVEVRVSDCELCDRISYLPARGIEIEYDGKSVSRSDLSAYSGRPGSVVFNTRNFMVTGVYYWKPRSVEGDE